MSDVASTVRESSIFENKLDILMGQNNDLERCWKDLYEIKNQLSGISKRVGSVSHPDNLEKMNVGDKPQPNGIAREHEDGLIGKLQEVVDFRNALLTEYHSSILPKLQNEISHLQKHL